MSDTAVKESASVQTLRRLRTEQGAVYWDRTRPDMLTVLDPQITQTLEAMNFADLTMLDDVADVIRGRKSAPFDWHRLRAAWQGQMRQLMDADGLRRLGRDMTRIVDADVGRPLDLLWLSERASIDPLVTAIVAGLGPVSRHIVVAEVLSKVAWVLGDVDHDRVIPMLHKPKMILLQLLAGIVVRRELKGRATGRRPRQPDLADPVVDLMPTLGLGRAVDAVTALLTAITGSPGAAAGCLLFELQRQHAWRARLEAELSNLSLDALCEGPTRQAPVTARFVKEVLRIWSSPPVVTRPVRTDLSLDGIKLCPGQQYTISAYMLHHDDRDWHDPERFDPDRWLSESRSQCPHGSYVPFGWAPKNCVGANLGMAQLMILAHLFCTRFRIDQPHPERASMAVASLVRPKDFEGTVHLRDDATDGDRVAAEAP